jgi:hypothetical protein
MPNCLRSICIDISDRVNDGRGGKSGGSRLTVQGLGYLLPTNLRIYFEIQKPHPDGEKIGRWMHTYVRVVAVQGVMQVAIIVVMARFATGLSSSMSRFMTKLV